MGQTSGEGRLRRPITPLRRDSAPDDRSIATRARALDDLHAVRGRHGAAQPLGHLRGEREERPRESERPRRSRVSRQEGGGNAVATHAPRRDGKTPPRHRARSRDAVCACVFPTTTNRGACHHAPCRRRSRGSRRARVSRCTTSRLVRTARGSARETRSSRPAPAPREEKNGTGDEQKNDDDVRALFAAHRRPRQWERSRSRTLFEAHRRPRQRERSLPNVKQRILVSPRKEGAPQNEAMARAMARAQSRERWREQRALSSPELQSQSQAQPRAPRGGARPSRRS